MRERQKSQSEKTEVKFMPIEKVIVLEDDPIIRKNLEQQFRSRGYDVASAPTLAAARQYLAKDSFDLVVADVKLPDGDGTDLLRQMQSRPVKPIVIMISGHASVESAVDCMKHGAFDYLIKPFSWEQLEVAVKKAENYTQLVKVNQYLTEHDDIDSGYELLGKSQPMDQLRQLIRKVARTQATVLIQGESGTGKELVARALFKESPRADAPFIKVNCAAIPENLIESEFFGHEKGAFTGALNKREGRFELAHGGTILLDEVSEITPGVQVKLLRVLQERELERVGGNKTIRVDTRVIATTNRNLEESVANKEFREDLYFRLNVVPIRVPPLRERMEDVPLLAEQFMQRYVRKHGAQIMGMSTACSAALMQHNWPGNVRELQNVIERAVILCADGESLRPEHLGLPHTSAVSIVETLRHSPTPVLTALDAVESIPTLSELEKELIFAALKRCNNNRTHAAKMIGISLRTLRNKLSEYRRMGITEFTTPGPMTDAEEPAQLVSA